MRSEAEAELMMVRRELLAMVDRLAYGRDPEDESRYGTLLAKEQLLLIEAQQI